MGDTTIEWTHVTWNPVRGCSRISPGCGGANHQGGCYAEKIAARFSEPGMPFHGFAERTEHGGRWTGGMALVEDKLAEPLHWRKPRRIFVNSMSDLFHRDLPDAAIDKVFAVMALAPQHTFQVLTKRADRMLDYCAQLDNEPVRDTVRRIVAAWPDNAPVPHEIVFPLPNVWLGVSVEDRQRARERIPGLKATPAAIRFLSAEPLLEDLGELDLTSIDLVIVGGESGPRSRPFDIEWARSIVGQCRKAGVACFVKQLGARPIGQAGKPLALKDRKGGDMEEWPADLRIRQLPTTED